MSLLSDDEIARALVESPWERDCDAIARDFSFADFAEAANHHPDILVHGWNKVRLELSTHSQGGITRADLDMARTLDGVG
jgi:4a-hydroxytetrahydrobiopterin dehydratase